MENRLISRIKSIKDKRLFHITFIVSVVVIVLIVALYFILEYDEQGEKLEDIPFVIEKVNVVSSITSTNISDDPTVWKQSIDQNNDIFIYLEKNDLFQKKEYITDVKLDNFNIVSDNSFEKVIYKPSAEDGLFKNVEDNVVESLDFVGDSSSDVKNLIIANNGDVLKFRLTQKDVYVYESADDVIDYNLLLADSNLTMKDFETKLFFDISISTNTERTYKTQVVLDIPIDGFIQNGKSSKEIFQKGLIFKRQ